ncbi:uncharacterized protein LOC144748713 [Ciona intestinalis]
MANENQQDPINLNITIPSIVVNRNDNREIALNIENAEHVTHSSTTEQPRPQHDSSQGHVTHTVEQPSVSQATSSLQDMQINPQGSSGGVTPRKPTIKEAFGPPDIGQLIQEKKYYKAYVISCRRIFDPAVIGPNGLGDHYRCCMLVGETEEAIRIKEQLKKLIKEKFQTTPDEIETFAHTIRGEGRDTEAILFDQIAAEFYGNQSEAGLVGIANCAWGIQQFMTAMLSRDKELKPTVGSHVIPLMQRFDWS